MKLKRWTAAVMAAVITFASIPMSSIAVTSSPRARDTTRAVTRSVATGSNASINITNAPKTMKKNESITLNTAVVIASASDAVKLEYNWTSSDENVIKVETPSASNATIKAVGAGTATVSVNFQVAGHSDWEWGKESTSCEIQVNEETKNVTINLDTGDFSMKVGENKNVVASVQNAKGSDVIWSVTGDASAISIATSSDALSATAAVTASAGGEATLTASIGEVTKSCKITVENTNKPTLTLNHSSLSMKVGGAPQEVIAMVTNAKGSDVKWTFEGDTSAIESNISSNETSSSVTVTPKAKGHVRLTASIGTATWPCEIEITENTGEPTLTLSHSSLSMKAGGTPQEVVAMVTNADGNDVKWSFDGDTNAIDYTISSNEKASSITVTAKEKGKVTLTASVGTATGSCVIEITDNTSGPTLELNHSSLSMTPGGKAEEVIATVENAKGSDVVWSITGDAGVIAIATSSDAASAKAVVTAEKAGNASLIASVGNAKKTCQITVKDEEAPKLTDIILVPEALNLIENGASSELTAIVVDTSFADKVYWDSSNKEVATVSKKSVDTKTGECVVTVTPHKAGSADISVESPDGSIKRICKVTVDPEGGEIKPLKSITLNYNELTLMNGKSGEVLIATVDKADKDLVENIEWSFSKEGIVKLGETAPNTEWGTSNVPVTPVAVGTTTVTAKDINGNQKAACVINVVAVPEVKLSLESSSMKTGDSQYVKFTSNSDVELDMLWSVSDKEILALDEKSGKVTALKAGNAKVMADVYFRGEFITRAECEVEIKDPISPILKLEKTEIELAKEVIFDNVKHPGEAALRVINTTGKEATVTVNNKKVKAEFTEDGMLLITAVEEGTAIVTVKAGSLSAICTVTVTDTAGLDAKPVESEVEVDLGTVETPDVPSGSTDTPEEIERKTNEAVTTIINEILANRAALEPAKGLLKAINFALLKAELGLSEGEAVSVKIAPKLHTLKMEAVVDPKTGETKVVPVSMTFDVKPMAVTANGNAVIKNEWLKNARITFRLPMPLDAPTSSVLVNHEGTNLGYFAIKNKGTSEAYAEVDGISEFSNFTVTFKEKPSSSGGSGSGSAKGTSSTAKSNGEWMANGANWQYRYSDGTYARNEWAVIVWNGQPNWYHFNAEAMLDTGWIQDGGRWYYLHPQADGNRGYMYTGWKMIDGKWYYFYEVTGGPLGAMAANTTTPDGYVVGADGVWIQ